MKMKMRKIFSVLCVLVFLLALLAPCVFAETSLSPSMLSRAEIVNGKASYNKAAFGWIKFSIEDAERQFDANSLNLTGTATIGAATYSYREDGANASTPVNGIAQNFTLKVEEGMQAGDDMYFIFAKNDKEVDFVENAETGLNGINMMWTFPSDATLNGSVIIPNFRSTSEQLSSGVPYFEYIYNDDGTVKDFRYRVVTQNNLDTAISTDFNWRVSLRYKTTGNDSWAQRYRSGRLDAGVVIQGETDFNLALASSDITEVEVALYDRTNNIYGYNWRFRPRTTDDKNDNNGGNKNENQDDNKDDEQGDDNVASSRKCSSSGCNAGLGALAGFLFAAAFCFKRKS